MDSMFGIGGNELIVIVVLAIIVLGPERVARSVREIGKLARNLKSYFSALSDELRSELDIIDDLKKIKKDLLK